jgi:hypothetical protein
MRPKPRENKRERHVLIGLAAAKNGNESSEDEKERAPRPAKQKKIQVKPSYIRKSLEVGKECTETDAEIEANVAFCCKICYCPDAVKLKFAGNEYIQPSEECLWHRRCCHRVWNPRIDWLPEYEKSSAELEANMAANDFSFEEVKEIELVNPNEVYQKYLSNKRQEAELHNEDDDACK